MGFKIKIDAADKLFSLFVRWRAGWKCERCGGQYQPGDSGLQCSHFWGRGNESVRFDPDNASAHCFRCHQELTANPETHRAWKLARLGKAKYDALMVRAHLYCKKDRVAAKLFCMGLIRQLERERGIKILPYAGK